VNLSTSLFILSTPHVILNEVKDQAAAATLLALPPLRTNAGVTGGYLIPSLRSGQTLRFAQS
jgi:hypothetical protein